MRCVIAIEMKKLRRHKIDGIYRAGIVRGWEAVAEELDSQGQRDRAVNVRRFVQRMPPR